MKQISQRILIYPKDVMKITGKTHRTAQRLMARMKKYYGKQLITIREYCQYSNLEESYVRRHLVD